MTQVWSWASHLSLVLKSWPQGCRETSWSTCNAEPVDFFSVEALQNSMTDWRGLIVCKRLVTGGEDTSQDVRPGTNCLLSLRRFKTTTPASLPHTSPCIAVDKSGNGWCSHHLFCWNWDIVEKRTEGWYGQKRNMEEEGAQKGRLSFQLWVVFSQGHVRSKRHQQERRQNPRTSLYWRKQGWKFLLYKLWIDCRQENTGPASAS